MPLPTITPLPDPPARTQAPGTFSDNADAFMEALPVFQEEMNEFAEAIPAFIAPTNFNSVSATSLAIGTGSKSLTVEVDKLYFVGQFVIVASAASPANYMMGQVTSYDSGTGALVVNVTDISGSGTFASWSIGPTPAPASNVNPRIITSGSTTGTITPTADTADLYIMTGLTGPVTIAAPSGTPVNGQKLMLRIKDNGTTRALTWNAIYRIITPAALPSNTTPGKEHYVGLIYNSAASKWDAVASGVEA